MTFFSLVSTGQVLALKIEQRWQTGKLLFLYSAHVLCEDVQPIMMIVFLT